MNEWSNEAHEALEQELGEHVRSAWKEAVSYGTLSEGPKPPTSAMFEQVFKVPPPHLVAQRKQAGV